jgi:hypothetical protein
MEPKSREVASAFSDVRTKIKKVQVYSGRHFRFFLISILQNHTCSTLSVFHI